MRAGNGQVYHVAHVYSVVAVAVHASAKYRGSITVAALGALGTALLLLLFLLFLLFPVGVRSVWGVGLSSGPTKQETTTPSTPVAHQKLTTVLSETTECVPWVRVPSPSPGNVANWLFGATSVPSGRGKGDQIWTVGVQADPIQALILRSDGASWQHVPAPQLGEASNLLAVSGISDEDIWAAGYRGDIFGENTLVEHWDGSSWTVVNTPDAGEANYLYGIAALASDDVWAVGYSTIGRTAKTLIEHWDGTTWTIVPSPNPEQYSTLRDVAAISANDIWAVGNMASDGGVMHSLTLHWDGVSWQHIPSPNPSTSFNQLYSVTAINQDDVWAVGKYGVDEATAQALTLHWDGEVWRQVPSPGLGEPNALYGVSGASPTNVWAVGARGASADFQERTLLLHWNGTNWSVSHDPRLGTQQSRLADVTVDSSGSAWAAGYYGNPTLIEPSRTLIERHDEPCVPCGVDFSDVRPEDFCYTAVQYAYCFGIAFGYGDGTFRPSTHATRGQLAKMVVLAEGLPIHLPSRPTFADVPIDSPLYAFVETALHYGIVSGYSDKSFRPADEATRAQFCKLITLARGWQVISPAVGHFMDVTRDSPFYDYIETAYAHHAIEGYEDGSFRPGKVITRGQAVVIIHRAYAEMVASPKMPNNK